MGRGRGAGGGRAGAPILSLGSRRRTGVGGGRTGAGGGRAGPATLSLGARRRMGSTSNTLESMRNSRLCSLRSRALGGRLLLLLSGAGGLQGFMVPETLAGAGAGGGGWIPEPPPWLLEWWPPLQGAWSPCPGVLTDRVTRMSPSPSLQNVTFAALHVFCSFRKVRNRPYSSPTPAILAGRGV